MNWLKTLTLIVVTVSLSNLSMIPAIAQSIEIDVNVNHKHSVGGIDSFDRSKFITIHSDETEPDWTMGTNAVGDLRDDFLNRLDVYLGRNTGSLSGAIQFGEIDEDPTRPGFADPADIVRYGNQLKNFYRNRASINAYKDRNDLVVAAQIHPYYPDGKNTARGWAFSQEDTGTSPFGFATGEYMGRFIQESFADDAQPAPKWIEVINEPIYDLVTRVNPAPSDPQTIIDEIFQFHNGAATGIRSILGDDIPIGGYCTAFPDFEKDNFDRWDKRWKNFIDVSGENMDFWALHLYDWPSIFGGKQLYRKGSNVEATMDMLEQYSTLKLGEPKPLLISEYGAQMQDFAEDPWTPERDWLFLKSLSGLMMSFMDRPDMILKAIPFIVLKAEWGRDPNTGVAYNWRLMRNASEGEGETGDDWVYTEMVKIYELWSDVKGTRVDSYTLDPDIQTDAYIDGNKVYVILNNLYFEEQEVKINISDNYTTALSSVRVKHMYGNDGIPVLDEESFTSEPGTLTLGSEATMILEYTFDAPITIDETKDETKYYASTYLQEIGSTESVDFTFSGISKATHGEAVFRMGLGRGHSMSTRPRLFVNGTEVFVPANFKGDDQAERDSFFGVIEVPVPFDVLEDGDNEVSLQFSDDGGHVSSMAMRVYHYSSMPERSPGPAVTGVESNPASATILVGGQVQLTETILPLTAGNQSVEWTSADESIASVGIYGLVKGLAEGDVMIMATSSEDPSLSASTLVKVRTTIRDSLDCTALPQNVLVFSPTTYKFDIPYVAGENRTLVVDIRKDLAVWQGSAIINLPVGEGVINAEVFMNTQLGVDDKNVRVIAYIRPTDSDFRETTFSCETFVDVVDVVTGVEDEISKEKVYLYPNPVENELRIFGLKNVLHEYAIVNLLGNVVKVGSMQGSEALNLEALSSGMYLLKIEKGTDIIALRFIK